MEMQQWFSFALLSMYDIFCAAVENTNVLWSTRKASNNVLLLLKKSGFFSTIFKMVSNTKLHENMSIGRWLDTWGQTDGREEAKSRFSQFSESASKKPASRSGRCTPRGSIPTPPLPGIDWNRRFVGSRVDPKVLEKSKYFVPMRIPTPDLPARSPATTINYNNNNNNSPHGAESFLRS